MSANTPRLWTRQVVKLVLLLLLSSMSAACVGDFPGDSSNNGAGANKTVANPGGNMGNNANATGPTTHIPPASPCTSNAPAPRTLRRLTQAELNATLVDLFGAGVPVTTSLFAADPTAYGFHDIQYNLTVSNNAASDVQTMAESVATYAATQLNTISSCTTMDPTCQQTFISTFGKKAFRRPLTSDEVQAYTGLLSGISDFPTAAQTIVSAMLQSPFFLYRGELGTSATGTTILTSYEIASELSYMIIGSMPDAPLLQAADGNALGTPAQIAAQATRLLQDKRAQGTVAQFFQQWTGVSDLPNLSRVEGNTTLPPDIAVAMQGETGAFVDDLVFNQNGTYTDLLTANRSFLSAPLASFYGVSGGGNGNTFAAVTWQNNERMPGILGEGGTLSANAQATYASPTIRGRTVRMRLLCDTIGQPPGGVPPLAPEDASQTTRQRFVAHINDPSCSSCHQYMDPLGFTMGDFDTLGRARAGGMENGQAVDTSGDLAFTNGAPEQTLQNGTQLAQALAQDGNAAACLGRHWAMYTYGQLSWDQDSCTFNAVAQYAGANGWTLRQILIGLTQAPSFTTRVADP